MTLSGRMPGRASTRVNHCAIDVGRLAGMIYVAFRETELVLLHCSCPPVAWQTVEGQPVVPTLGVAADSTLRLRVAASQESQSSQDDLSVRRATRGS